MNLFRLARKKWDVLAIASDREECQVLEYLSSMENTNPAVKRILNRLLQHIPENGPEIRNEDKAKRLKNGDGIWELKQHIKKGGTPRIYYFNDGDRTVICCLADLKKGKSGAQKRQIDKAKELKEAYFRDKAKGNIDIVTDLTELEEMQ